MEQEAVRWMVSMKCEPCRGGQRTTSVTRPSGEDPSLIRSSFLISTQVRDLILWPLIRVPQVDSRSMTRQIHTPYSRRLPISRCRVEISVLSRGVLIRDPPQRPTRRWSVSEATSSISSPLIQRVRTE